MIKITCQTKDTLTFSELTEFQGGLKIREEDDVQKVVKSIKKHGFAFPFFVWKHDGINHILDGHNRVNAIKRLIAHGEDIPPLPVVYVSCKDEAEAKEILLKLNSQYGKMTAESVQAFIEGIDIDIQDLALPDGVLDLSIKREEDEETTGDDEVPEVQKEVVSKYGEIYELGNSLLMCGDSTNEGDVKRLMGTDKADMVFTDPPYNIAYQGVNDKRSILNDKMDDDSFVNFLKKAIPVCSCIYVCCSWQYSYLFKRAMEEKGMPPKAMIIWDKVNPAQHLDKYFKQHELIFYYGKFGGEKTLRGDIWVCKRQKNTIHPTMKPIELIEIALKDNPDKKIIYDAFAGSGSTLIACEKNYRKTRLMELDPKYCDVIRRRYTQWAKENGKPLTRGCLD